jgi:two-component system response regulator FixJ
LAAESIKSGAIDFIPKPFEANKLLDAVNAAVTPGANSRAEEKIRLKKRLEALSPMEQRVLAGLANGQTNASIALALGVSTRTAETCRANILTKTDAKSLSHVVRLMLLNDFNMNPLPQRPKNAETVRSFSSPRQHVSRRQVYTPL